MSWISFVRISFHMKDKWKESCFERDHWSKPLSKQFLLIHLICVGYLRHPWWISYQVRTKWGELNEKVSKVRSFMFEIHLCDPLLMCSSALTLQDVILLKRILA